MNAPTLTAPAGKGWLAHDANVAMAAGQSKKFPTHWLEPDVQGTLYATQGRVCGYCGARLGANDPGDVEHFRPKAKVTDLDAHPGYWWLAYALTNYVFACRVCNSSRKGNRFPVNDEGTRVVDAAGDLAAEARVLFHPHDDDLDEIVTVDLLHACRIVARATADRDRVREVVTFFDLDRADLCKERLEVRDAVVEAIEQGDLGRARRLAARHAPHSAAALAVLVGAGHQQATAAQELEWHVLALVRQLDTALRLQETETDADLRKKRSAEVVESAWALAAVWKDPQGGSPAEVEVMLQAAGIAEQVRPLRDQL